MSNIQTGREWQRRREDAGLEQDQAAESLGIHRVTLSRYESGQRAIPPRVVREMGRLYGISAAPVARETTPTDPVAALVHQGQAEQAAWVLEFAAKLLEAGAQRLRQGVQREAIISAVEATEATITRPTAKRRRVSEG
jgi:transcriptional regulator with XRE-family HTH domain